MFLMDWFYGVLASLGLWQKEAKILFLGNKIARKITLRRMIRDERLVQHQPTEYPTSGEFSIGKIKFKAFDLGDHQMVRRVLRDYYVKVDAVVYLVKCSHLGFSRSAFWVYCKYLEMIKKSRRELHALLSEEALANVPFLILVNKFEISVNWLGFDISENMLCCELGLTNLTTGKGRVNLANDVRPLEVFVCSNVMGYEDGFKWLSQYIK